MYVCPLFPPSSERPPLEGERTFENVKIAVRPTGKREFPNEFLKNQNTRAGKKGGRQQTKRSEFVSFFFSPDSPKTEFLQAESIFYV